MIGNEHNNKNTTVKYEHRKYKIETEIANENRIKEIKLKTNWN